TGAVSRSRSAISSRRGWAYSSVRFVLWAVIAEDRSGDQPVAAAPADLRIAKKAPEVVAVPQAPAPNDAAEAAATATLQPSAPAKPPSGITATIIDGRTGAKREVVGSAAAPADQRRHDRSASKEALIAKVQE